MKTIFADFLGGRLVAVPFKMSNTEKTIHGLVNLSRSGAKDKVNRALPFGISDGMLCTEDKDPVRNILQYSRTNNQK
jgi:hypothetical protein